MADLAQSSSITAKRRGPGRPFPKGVTGNPGGRPRGLSAFICKETREGQELARYVLTVFRDETARPADRMAAATWLADRGFGKPVQALEHSGTVEGPRPLTPEARALLADPWARALMSRLARRQAELEAGGGPKSPATGENGSGALLCCHLDPDDCPPRNRPLPGDVAPQTADREARD